MEVNFREVMAEAKFYESYSRYNDETGSYETWEEAVERVMQMHRKKYADVMSDTLDEYITYAGGRYKDQLILGAQRALQFGGDQIFKHNIKMYNCVSSHCNRAAFFGEMMYMLLCGAGAGFSVQKHHVAQLPKIARRGKRTKTFVVEDSIEGWAEAVDVLMSSYFEEDNKFPEFKGCHIAFDLTKIRPKGAMISGGFLAPGHEPLLKALDLMERLLEDHLNGKKSIELSPLVCYDLCMYAADAVISGGVRRSATICLFSHDDEELLKAKTGNWFITHPQRGRSNNSAVILRDKITREEFSIIMENIKQFGEPGFIFTDDPEFTFNP